jgi:hypothetical protein
MSPSGSRTQIPGTALDDPRRHQYDLVVLPELAPLRRWGGGRRHRQPVREVLPKRCDFVSTGPAHRAVEQRLRIRVGQSGEDGHRDVEVVRWSPRMFPGHLGSHRRGAARSAGSDLDHRDRHNAPPVGAVPACEEKVPAVHLAVEGAAARMLGDDGLPASIHRAGERQFGAATFTVRPADRVPANAEAHPNAVAADGSLERLRARGRRRRTGDRRDPGRKAVCGEGDEAATEERCASQAGIYHRAPLMPR